MKKFFFPIFIIAILLIGTSAYAAVKILGTAGHGQVLDWSMDENTGTTVADNSGNGRSGTLYGTTPPSWVDPGRFGKALSFDGNDQYVESDAPIASLGTIDQPYSISTWVKIPSLGGHDGNIIHISDGQNGYGWCIPFMAIVGGKFSAISYNSGAVYATQSDTPSTDAWHHVVETWSSANGLRLFVDGVLKATTSQGNFTAANDSVYVQLARGSGGCVADTGFFKGSIDDVRVYSRELSQSQISSLYSSNTDSVATIHSRYSGLAGNFYSGDNFNTFVSSAVDQTINFYPADYSIGAARAGTTDHFTARWTGYITPQYTEDYTFYTVSDDGARLYIGDQSTPLINTWILQGATEHSNTISLIAGHTYPIKLEFWENDGGAVITLSWSSNSTPKNIIPGSALSYGGSTTIVNDSRNSRITNGLAGLWSFNGADMQWNSSSSGTAYDRSGGGNNGTLTNMSRSTSPTPGVIGQALSFDGATSCVTTPLQINNSQQFTLAGWIYPHSITPEGFFGQNDSIEFGFNSSGEIEGWTPTVGRVDWNASSLTINKWHHVAFVGDGTQELLYVDGVMVASQPGTVGNYGSSGDYFNIGGCGVFDHTDDYFNGKIDDVRAYTRALSANQIKQLYAMGSR